MGAIKFTNNASSLLAASITDVGVTVQVSSGQGALFPSPGAGEYFLAALLNAAGDFEVVKCTARSGDLITIVRGQEGTAARAWTNGVTRFELRVTKGTMEAMVQKAGDTMSGDLDMSNNKVKRARITDTPVIVGGQTVGTAIRGTEDDDSNEIVVPDDGSRATAGGSPILTQEDGVMESMPIGAMIMWYGSIGSLPAGWHVCDGTGGTPDFRGKFPIGAGGALSLGASGGSATAAGTTSTDGDHTHSLVIDGHSLSVAEMPVHHHSLRGSSGGGITASGSIPGGFGLLSDFSGGHSAGAYYETLTIGGVQLVEDTGAGSAHTHTGVSDSSGAHSHDLSSISILPPYKAVYFILKVA